MNLKGHTILFLICLGILGLILAIWIHAYGRILVILANVPFLDPDNDQGLKGVHRWWYSHSILPGLLCTWAFIDVIPQELWFYPFVGFCGYAMIHLLGDLKSTKGFGSIRLYPLKKSINARIWIGLNLLGFMGGLIWL